MTPGEGCLTGSRAGCCTLVLRTLFSGYCQTVLASFCVR
jgi:hypothetical protein